jgi:hypothetical protein
MAPFWTLNFPAKAQRRKERSFDRMRARTEGRPDKLGLRDTPQP